MKKSYSLILLVFSLIAIPLFAQASGPLKPAELSRKRWYYSLEEALANPNDVYKLSLAGKKLKYLPPEILQLKNLQLLNLNDNKLEELPADIGQLKNLQSLSLYDNKLEVLPMSVRSMGHLETLYVGKNRLIELPIWVGGLGNLKRLDVSYNRMTPKELMSIRNRLPKCNVTY